MTSTPPFQSRVCFPSALELQRHAKDENLICPVPTETFPLQISLSLEPSDEAPLSSPLSLEAGKQIHRDHQPPEYGTRGQ